MRHYANKVRNLANYLLMFAMFVNWETKKTSFIKKRERFSITHILYTTLKSCLCCLISQTSHKMISTQQFSRTSTPLSLNRKIRKLFQSSMKTDLRPDWATFPISSLNLMKKKWIQIWKSVFRNPQTKFYLDQMLNIYMIMWESMQWRKNLDILNLTVVRIQRTRVSIRISQAAWVGLQNQKSKK